MNGECYKCDFYHKEDDRCMRAEKAFGSMVDPICLEKMQVILLRTLSTMLADYIYEDEGDG